MAYGAILRNGRPEAQLVPLLEAWEQLRDVAEATDDLRAGDWVDRSAGQANSG